MTELDLVTLLVADAERSKRFYRDVLGLEVVKDSRGYVELAGGGGKRLALFPARELAKLLDLPAESVRARGGSVVVSLVLDDLDEGYEGAVEQGAAPFRPPAEAPWGSRVAFLHDPDGNLVELRGA